jgi:hypothetical protein
VPGISTAATIAPAAVATASVVIRRLVMKILLSGPVPQTILFASPLLRVVRDLELARYGRQRGWPSAMFSVDGESSAAGCPPLWTVFPWSDAEGSLHCS